MRAQVYLDSDWLRGYGFLDARSGKVSWDRITEWLN